LPNTKRKPKRRAPKLPCTKPNSGCTKTTRHSLALRAWLNRLLRERSRRNPHPMPGAFPSPQGGHNPAVTRGSRTFRYVSSSALGRSDDSPRSAISAASWMPAIHEERLEPVVARTGQAPSDELLTEVAGDHGHAKARDRKARWTARAAEQPDGCHGLGTSIVAGAENAVPMSRASRATWSGWPWRKRKSYWWRRRTARATPTRPGQTISVGGSRTSRPAGPRELSGQRSNSDSGV
jgi:hypothetical protein